MPDDTRLNSVRTHRQRASTNHPKTKTPRAPAQTSLREAFHDGFHLRNVDAVGLKTLPHFHVRVLNRWLIEEDWFPNANDQALVA